MAVVGSLSRSGQRALAQELELPVLINPCGGRGAGPVAHISTQVSWHDPNQRVHGNMYELRAHRRPMTRPTTAGPLIAKGDEVLDWREMLATGAAPGRFDCEGSDHALSDFRSLPTQLLDFLDLAPEGHHYGHDQGVITLGICCPQRSKGTLFCSYCLKKPASLCIHIWTDNSSPVVELDSSNASGQGRQHCCGLKKPAPARLVANGHL
jgi:hypothetical protein